MEARLRRELPRGSSRQLRFIPILLAAALSGCSVSRKPEESPEREGKNPGLTLVELDQLARNYSDRLVIRISCACDQIKQEIQDREAFAKAHELKLTVALSAYDIITSQGETVHIPGAIQRLIDLLILTQLQAIKWIEEDEGRKSFGEQGGEQLSIALGNSWDDLRALAGRVLKPEQLDHLKAMVANWRHENPEAEWLTSVRLDKIAQAEEGQAFVKSVGEGFTAPDTSLRPVDDLRLIAQQELFYLKRMPILLDWALEATLGSMTVVPKSNSRSGEFQSTEGTLVESLRGVEGLSRHFSKKTAELTEAIAQANDLRELPSREATVEPVQTSPRKEAFLGASLNRSATSSREDRSARQPSVQAQETWGLPAAVLKNVDAVLNQSRQNLSGRAYNVTNNVTGRVLILALLAAVVLTIYKMVAFCLHALGVVPRPAKVGRVSPTRLPERSRRPN